MSWLSRKSEAQPKEEPLYSPVDSFSDNSFGDDFSNDHLGAMASPNYCNDITCWCHTNVEYHDTVTSLPTDVTGDDAYRALGTILESENLYMW